MGIYKFKSKGPAYGLGHSEGELVIIDEEKGIDAMCLVPEVSRDPKGQMVNTGRQVMAKKHYTVEYLLQNDVIAPTTAADRKSWESGEHINALADKAAEKAANEDRVQREATADRIKGKK